VSGGVESRWDRVIPHYALTAGLLPEPGASWDELVYFAGTFDGYVVFAEPHVFSQFVADSRERFAADTTLPEGLTMLRTALHGEQRYSYWDEGELPTGETLRYIHAIVEGIRELVVGGAHMAPQPWTVGGIRDKVMNAYDRLLVGYASWGGYRYHGWTAYEDERNFVGPVIWSERDCDLRFAVELEKEWPGAIHMEVAISRSSRADYDPMAEKFQRVDVAVSDLASFVEGADSQARFRTHRHEAFFEVKWFPKGWNGNRDAKARWSDIPLDVAKLARHIELERCAVAGMLVVDDEGYFDQQTLEGEWPKNVRRLHVGPGALSGRGLLADEEG
jgi:hypothetical protein